MTDATKTGLWIGGTLVAFIGGIAIGFTWGTPKQENEQVRYKKAIENALGDALKKQKEVHEKQINELKAKIGLPTEKVTIPIATTEISRLKRNYKVMVDLLSGKDTIFGKKKLNDAQIKEGQEFIAQLEKELLAAGYKPADVLKSATV